MAIEDLCAATRLRSLVCRHRHCYQRQWGFRVARLPNHYHGIDLTSIKGQGRRLHYDGIGASGHRGDVIGTSRDNPTIAGLAIAEIGDDWNEIAQRDLSTGLRCIDVECW